MRSIQLETYSNFTCWIILLEPPNQQPTTNPEVNVSVVGDVDKVNVFHAKKAEEEPTTRQPTFVMNESDAFLPQTQ